MNVADYIKASGCTQEEFAARAGLAQSNVSRIVNGKQKPDPDTAVQIVVVTEGQVTLNEIYGVPKKYWKARQ